MSHMVHAEGRDFRSRYRLVVSEGCFLDGFTDSSISELYKYGSDGVTGYDLCRGPDGQPWAAIIEGYGTGVGGGEHRGPFIYRWNGAAWAQITCAATTDGGIGTEQALGDYRAEWLGVINGGFGNLGSLGNDINLWGNISFGTAHDGSHATASYEAGVNPFDASIPTTAYIACDGSNVYGLWHHATYYRYENVDPPDTYYWFLYVRRYWRVRQYDGATWTELGAGTPNTHYADQSNNSATDWVGSDGLVLRADATGAYVWYRDYDSDIAGSAEHYVAHWNGAAWEDLGGGSIADLSGYLFAGDNGDMQLDGQGHPTIFVPGGNIGLSSDLVAAITFDGANWQTDTYQIAYPNFDIPDGLSLIVQGTHPSPLRGTGDYVVGAQCNRDGYESYFATFAPDTRTWATFLDGAKLVGSNTGSGQIVFFSLVAPEANRLWLSSRTYGGAGPQFWIYSPLCHCWQEAEFVDGATGPLSVGGNWWAPYRDGAALYIIENSYDGGLGAYAEYVWRGTIGHGLVPWTAAVAANPPSNDDFADALTIVGASGQANPIDINRASVEVDEPTGSCLSFGPVAQTVWFKWTAPADGTVTFDTELSSDACTIQPDTTLTVWTGASLAALTEIACDDDSGVGLTSRLTFSANSGTTYYIQAGMAYEGGACDHLVLAWAQAGAGGDTYLHATYRIDGAAQGPYAINTKIGGIQLGSISSSQGMANHLIRNVKIGTSSYGSTEIWDEALTSGSVVPPFDSQTGGGDLSITGSGMQVLNATGNDAYGEKDFAASGDLYIQFEVNFDATEVSGGNDGFSIPLVVLDDTLTWIDALGADFRSGAGNYLKWSTDYAPAEFGGPIADSTWYTVDLFYSTT